MARDLGNPDALTFDEALTWVDVAPIPDVLSHIERRLDRATCDAAIDSAARLVGRLRSRIVKEEDARR